MGRADGFPTADIAVGHLDDDKVRKLWRILAPDQGAMTEAITTHLAVVLASWGSGRRKTLDEALPIWLAPSTKVVDALVESRLLDRAGRVPPASWDRHFSPAASRRIAARDAGREGARRRWGPSEIGSEKGRDRVTMAPEYPSGRQAGPSSPSGLDRPKRATRASRGGGASLGETMRAEGGFASTLVEKQGGKR